MGKTIKNIFYFGEKIKEFDVRVLNEREVRASAGILFCFAMIAFMNAWLIGNFNILKIFIITFLIDFFIRIFINPKYSPSIILGRIMVRNQKPEYVGAPQKRFAWGIGFILAITMFFIVVVNNILGPINLFICLACLILLFFETAFGICIGCIVYNLFNKERAKLCPGGICEIKKKEPIQKINFAQIVIVILFILSLVSISYLGVMDQNIAHNANPNFESNDQNITDCRVPDWAISMGHEKEYKLHHGCE
ncbi:DUF4395 domain-containing protein [Candidatus Woesearchaeota archaeon]|jgi:hypothetical protein|nr:DUF4395 domain-containing protein [Candidatus Woesearchaeota archaeon]MBT4835069.1 DUF4395 domain-containing protein [Candidatus Woesearchaeota archaeon]MBT6735336.1 DUF4395 domain-containing protein [Candidatus Woesearchaeota archaeon]MBT7169670.1 DUF4395 domain-containing protein [Candidatus Woesearchaeota archaeon]MBT7474904.1 DUF4395 domain-containing protein [Candidatus Woesearchaeota archaeon]